MSFATLALSTLGSLLTITVMMFALRHPRAGRWMACATILALIGFGVSATEGVGDGSFPQAEYQLTVLEARNRPLEGVELRVETMEGHVAHLFPITDYVPGARLATDRNGDLVCHHVKQGSEFPVRWRYVLGVFTVETAAPPDYWCVFLNEGREVKRIRYSELTQLDEAAPRVKRVWKWREIVSFPEDEVEAYQLVEGFSKRDGKWIRDLAQAYRTGDQLWTQERWRRKGAKEVEDKELTFQVVKRTIRVND